MIGDVIACFIGANGVFDDLKGNGYYLDVLFMYLCIDFNMYMWHSKLAEY